MMTILAKPLLFGTVLATALVATLHAPLASGQANDSGEEIFARARAVWLAMIYPPIIDYTVAIDASNGTTHTINHYAGQALTASSQCRVHAFSSEEDANPTAPRGINVVLSIGVGITSGSAPAGSANGATTNLAGVNLAKPADLPSFGIYPCHPERSTVGA